MAASYIRTSNGFQIAGLIFEGTMKERDVRGEFIKILGSGGLYRAMKISEIFWTRSQFGVIRGMHMQSPPYSGSKLIWNSEGKICDVAFDTRPDSPTFGHWNSVELSPGNGVVYLPAGVAHGFQVLSDFATVSYAQECRYAPECDTGIRYDSFGFDWPTGNPTISARDAALPSWNHWVRGAQ